MLLLILCGITLDKTDMCAHLVPIITKVDEFAHLVGIVRLMSRKHGNNRVRSHAVERIRVARDDAFQRVILHDVLLECLLGFRFAGHGGLRDNDRRARSVRQ